MLPTSSKIALAAICLFPWSPHAPPAPPDKSGAPAQLGNAAHDAAEEVSEDALRDVGRALVTASDLDVDAMAAKHKLTPSVAKKLVAIVGHLRDLLERDGANRVEAERCYFYDPSTDTGGATGYHRDYTAVPPGAFGGTTDLVLWHDDRVTVRDYKTGIRARAHRPRETPQLRMLGLAVARALGLDEIDVELVHVDEHGAYPVRDHLDAFDIAQIAGELAELRDAIERPAQPIVPVPGMHCVDMYCPLRAVCPATLAAVQAIGLALEPPGQVLNLPETAEEASRARYALKVFEARAVLILEACRAVALREPVPVLGRPGVVWVARQMPGAERIDIEAPGAETVLYEQLGSHAALAIERTVTKASIEVAVRKAVFGEKRGALGKKNAAVLAALRSAKAVKVGSPFKRFEEVKRAVDGGVEPPIDVEAYEETEGAAL